MNKKRVIIIAVIIACLLVGIPVGYFLLNPAPVSTANWSLNGAPQNIVIIHNDLAQKIQTNNLSWDDLPEFVVYSRYVANNCPEVLQYFLNWNNEILFSITDGESFWIQTQNGNLTMDCGAYPPTTFDLTVTLDTATALLLLTQKLNAQTAYLQGKISVDGSLQNSHTFSEILSTIVSTIIQSSANAPAINLNDAIQILANNNSLTIPDGLTLIPAISIELNTSAEGQPFGSQIVNGTLIIVDDTGKIVAQLDNCLQSVVKFINSTTVLLGGNEGNLQLWNYKTNTLQNLPIPGGNHALDYDQQTDTFMVLDYIISNQIFNGLNISYDILSEYTRSGQLIWQWNGEQYFPFNSTQYESNGANETFLGYVDWMHSNSFVWDKENNWIYLNIRSLDSIIKIDMTNDQIIWEAGRFGNFTLYDQNGNQVSTLFYHPHGLEQIALNIFMVFDNDFLNSSNPSTYNGTGGFSHFIEFEINETAMTMTEIWSWGSINSSYYNPQGGGIAQRLPNGNTLGIFGDNALGFNYPDPTYLTEVTPTGQIAWELELQGINNIYSWVYTAERIYSQPIISITQQTLNPGNNSLNISLMVWNNVEQSYETPGIVELTSGSNLLYNSSFEFNPNWIATNLTIALNNWTSTAQPLNLVFENEEGIITTQLLFQPTTASTISFVNPYVFFGSILVILFQQTKKSLRNIKFKYFSLKANTELPKQLQRNMDAKSIHE